MKYSIVFLITVIFFTFPTNIFASSYGDGIYGDGVYGGDSSSSSNSVQSVTSAATTFFCSLQPPTTAPYLYEIDVTDTSATLFFTPAGNPNDTYFISYGQQTNNESYGTQFPMGNTTGALSYTINALSPNTAYTFMVRGGNGCKPGNWSNSLMITTQKNGIKITKKFYVSQSMAVIQTLKQNPIIQSSPVYIKPPIDEEQKEPEPIKKNFFSLGIHSKFYKKFISKKITYDES